jgi:ABC-type phosphate transport system substrate-binding protein
VKRSTVSFARPCRVVFTVIVATLLGSLAVSAQAITFANYTTANGLGSNSVNGVYASGSDVYAATHGGVGISTDGGSTFTNYTTANGLGNNIVRGVYASGNTVYAATDGGLSIATVPEPSTWVMGMAGLGFGGYSMWRLRKRA